MPRKRWLSAADQVDLLRHRGLLIEEAERCEAFLNRVNYYRFSGYARFFQQDPARGDNRFRPGTTLGQIRRVYTLDSALRDLASRHLGRVETALRSRFALRFGERVTPYETFWEEGSYHSAGADRPPVHELVLRDLDRSKAPFIKRHRTSSSAYPDLPVWAAVEVLSFGTLSKCVEYCVHDDVRHAMAEDFGVGNSGFSSQIRSFVAMRNECAHGSRLWNDVAKNPPSVATSHLRRAKRRVGQFSDQSHYKTLIALDLFNADSGHRPTITAAAERLMGADPNFRDGILAPTPY